MSVCKYFLPAVQDLKEEIDIRLSRVQDIKYEPQLLAEDDGRLLQLETPGTVSEVLSCTVPWGQVTPLTAPVAVLSRETLSLLLFSLSSLPSKVCRDLSLCFPFTRLL